MFKKKQKINLREFILNGKFNSVELGMTREEVINKLGKPEWYGLGDDSSEMTADMWTYGNIEFYFSYDPPGVNRLGMIFRDNLISGINGGESLKIIPWILKNKKLTLKKALKMLNRKKIPFNIDEKILGSNLHININFKSGTQIVFIKSEINKIARLECVNLNYYYWEKNNLIQNKDNKISFKEKKC